MGNGCWQRLPLDTGVVRESLSYKVTRQQTNEVKECQVGIRKAHLAQAHSKCQGLHGEAYSPPFEREIDGRVARSPRDSTVCAGLGFYRLREEAKGGR